MTYKSGGKIHGKRSGKTKINRAKPKAVAPVEKAEKALGGRQAQLDKQMKELGI